MLNWFSGPNPTPTHLHWHSLETAKQRKRSWLYYQSPINKHPLSHYSQHTTLFNFPFLHNFFSLFFSSSHFPKMENPSPTFSLFPILGFILFFLASFVCQAQARAFFVFGDSLVDNGNNNYLLTTARADNYPYGIDYPTRRPTGRFSNGLNIPDLISLVCFLCFVPVTLSYKSNLSKWMYVLCLF